MQQTFMLAPGEGKAVSLGGLGAIYKLRGEDTGGAFAVVEHPLAPGFIGAPIHTHRNEDEYSSILEGQVTIQIGDQVLRAGPGALVLKPRGIPHAFWNEGPQPVRLLEIISPAGFERYFEELAELIPPDRPPDVSRLAALWGKYGLEMDMESVARIAEQYHVRLM